LALITILLTFQSPQISSITNDSRLLGLRDLCEWERDDCRNDPGFVDVVSPIPTRMETGHWIASTIVRMMLPRRVTEIVDVVSLIPTRMEMGRPIASMSALTTILLFVPFVKAGIPMIVKAARGNTTKLGRNAV